MGFNKEMRAEVKKVERHWKSNFIIRCFIFGLDIIAGLIFVFADLRSTFLQAYTWAALVPSMVWVLVVAVIRLVRVAPLHPGIHVGFELIIFLDVAIIQVFAYTELVLRSGWMYQYFSISTTGVLCAGMIACISLSIVSIFHFYLFIRACIETSRSRNHEIAVQAAAIAAQMVKNMESSGVFYQRNSDASHVIHPFGPTMSGAGPGEGMTGEGHSRPRGGGGGGIGDSISASGHGHGENTIIGLENLHHYQYQHNLSPNSIPNDNPNTNLHHSHNNNNPPSGLAPARQFSTSRMSTTSHGAHSTRTARTGRTMFSEARTQYSHARSLSVPVPTSPMSLRTARTDEPSLFRVER